MPARNRRKCVRLGHEAYSCDIQEPSGGHPEWHILGDALKTIEVRKTRPKLDTPFKCYIYKCGNGKVIGEFLCDQIIEDRTYGHNEEFYRAACMSAYDVAAYAMQSPMYGWHISDLRVYDHPRELDEFTGLRITKDGFELSLITRQPQSWRYVEEMKNV